MYLTIFEETKNKFLPFLQKTDTKAAMLDKQTKFQSQYCERLKERRKLLPTTNLYRVAN